MPELEQIIGHTFKDSELAKKALTLAHGSHSAAYERLEFLGDRVLGLVISDALLKQHPSEKEGDIAKRFAYLVREETLANLANEIDLPSFLITKDDALRTNNSILADVFEALCGALFLDGGLIAAQNFILPLFSDLLLKKAEPPLDAKTALQEWGHRRNLGLPVYTMVSKSGPDHNPSFWVSVKMEGYDPMSGEGTSKRAAEQDAAALFLKEYDHD